jgi:ATP-dependent protease ClpP protease subunit
MKVKQKEITNLADSTRSGDPAKLKTVWENAAKIQKPQALSHELLIYDRIGADYFTGGGITHQSVTDWLAGLEPSNSAITVRINSPGGDVFEGVGIYNALVAWQAGQDDRKITVKIDALAASIASVIAMAGDEIVIGGNAMMMIHRASTITMGNAADHLSTASTLESIDQIIVDTYEARTGQKPTDLKGWLDAETYMTAAESVERGFADRSETLKGKPETKDPETPDNQSVARLAAARLLVAQMGRPTVTAHAAN